MRRLLLAVLLCLAAPAAWAGVPPKLGLRLTESYIRPSVSHFANSAAALSGALDR